MRRQMRLPRSVGRESDMHAAPNQRALMTVGTRAIVYIRAMENGKRSFQINY